MSGQQEEAARTSTELEIRLVDGEELDASIDGDAETARRELSHLHERLVDQTFVEVGSVVVRSTEVRWIRLRQENGSRGGLLRNLLTGGENEMATRENDTTWRMERQPRAGQQQSRLGAPHWGETTPFMFTSEFVAYVLTVVAVAICTAVFDNLDVWHGMLLITALTGGYVLARGIAKAGTPYREHEQVRSRWADRVDGDST